MITNDESQALFDVVTDYAYALDTLDNYDYERLPIETTTQEERFHATYDNAIFADVMVRVVVNLINQKNE